MVIHEAYFKESCGDSVVLFIHGFLGSPGHFSGFLPIVPKSFGIYNILLEGHGRGSREFSKASMDIWKKQVDNVVYKLEKKYKKIYIAAHSLGTLLAFSAAKNHPHSIYGLWLLGSPLKIKIKAQAYKNVFKSLFKTISDKDAVALAYRNAHSVNFDKRLLYYVGWVFRYNELVWESKKARADVSLLDIPVFFYQSANDELVSLKSVEYLPKKGNIHLSVLENSAHFIYDEQDFSYLAREFSDFLKM